MTPAATRLSNSIKLQVSCDKGGLILKLYFGGVITELMAKSIIDESVQTGFL